MIGTGRGGVLLALCLLGCGNGAARTGTDGAADTVARDTGADTGVLDAPADVAATDVAADGAPSCNPAAIAFPQGGSLAIGTLCDEIYACADDAAGAARIQAASPRFVCAAGSEPGSNCTAYTCAYRNPSGPSTLDAAEIADVCALTALTPPPPLRCVVFLNAR